MTGWSVGQPRCDSVPTTNAQMISFCQKTQKHIFGTDDNKSWIINTNKIFL